MNLTNHDSFMMQSRLSQLIVKEGDRGYNIELAFLSDTIAQHEILSGTSTYFILRWIAAKIK